MPRSRREFSQQEIESVREMQIRGESRGEIARSLGVTASSFSWYMQCGVFGDLPRQPGRRAGGKGKLQKPDIESEGILFGVPYKDWRLRMIEIRDGWPDDERARRMDQVVPNRSDNYSLFKKNNPFLDNKSPPGRNPPECT